MNSSKVKYLVGLLVVLFFTACTTLVAESKSEDKESIEFSHTFQLPEDGEQQKATLANVSWLVGSWAGEAFGSPFEETWNPPSNGSMIGMFKLLDGDEVGFYELMLIVEENDSLAMKVKHFNADFSAWEAKPDYVNFPLVKLTDTEIHFAGLSFYKRSDELVEAYLLVDEDGEVTEHKLLYRKI